MLAHEKSLGLLHAAFKMIKLQYATTSSLARKPTLELTFFKPNRWHSSFHTTKGFITTWMELEEAGDLPYLCHFWRLEVRGPVFNES